MATDPGTDGAINLLSLPTEIMEAVANEVPAEDLPSLRLVCKDIDSKITRSYNQQCFSAKAFVLGSPLSMQNLAHISQHPRFSQALKRFTLVLQEVRYLPIGLAWKKWAENKKSGQATLNDEQRTEYFKLRRTYNDLIAHQRTFVASGWYPVFLDALRNLTSRNTSGIAIKITCRQHRHVPRQPEFEVLQHAIGLEFEQTKSETMRARATEVLRAVIVSQCQLKELALPDVRNEISPSALNIFAHADLISWSPWVSCIRVLDLAFTEFPLVRIDGLYRLLNTSPGLTTLKLRTQTDDLGIMDGMGDRCNGDVLAKIVTSAFMPSLKHADLDIPFQSRAGLVAFVQRHSGSLQHLQLYHKALELPTSAAVAVETRQLVSDAGVEVLKLRIVEDKANR